MSETTTAVKQLWGVYYRDREYVRELDDPLLTVIVASSKLAAEEAAARLGFADPWAHPVTAEQAKHAQWLPNDDAAIGNNWSPKMSHRIRI